MKDEMGRTCNMHGEIINAFKMARKLQWDRTIVRPKCRQKDNIKGGLRK
jgi:hypothetical protein